MRSDDIDPHPFESLSFGPFVALPFERRLVRDGTPVSLSSRAFDLLIALIERPGRVVNKRTLMKTAWPDSIVVDSCLRVQIAHLRKVLNDGHDGARYIMNVAGRGYCFVDSVQRSVIKARPAGKDQEQHPRQQQFSLLEDLGPCEIAASVPPILGGIHSLVAYRE